MHFTAFGSCFEDLVDAKACAADELERSDPRGAHPVLVDAAVVHCPIDWHHEVRPPQRMATAQRTFEAALGGILLGLRAS